MLADLRERVAKFGLTLHEDKTQLIEFGRLPSLDRKRQGRKRCETFAFLGFTHYCDWKRDDRFVVKRQTQSLRLTAKMKALRRDARQRRHAPVAEQYAWLSHVLRGHYAYFGLPSNFRMLRVFYEQVIKLLHDPLRRRSQRGMSWTDFRMLNARFPLPKPRITHAGGACAS